MSTAKPKAAAKPAPKPVGGATPKASSVPKAQAPKTAKAASVAKAAPKVAKSPEKLSAKSATSKPKAAITPAPKDPALEEAERRAAEEASLAQKAAEQAEHARRNGLVIVRYNHYKEEFTITNGDLAVADVDERLCLSFAFPKCRLHLTDVERSSLPTVEEDAEGKMFKNLQTGSTYWVLVEENAEEAKLSEERNRAYVQRKAEDKGNKTAECCANSKRGVDLITQELKGMSVEELREAGPRYKELLAARDLEDCLFN